MSPKLLALIVTHAAYAVAAVILIRELILIRGPARRYVDRLKRAHSRRRGTQRHEVSGERGGSSPRSKR